MISVEDASKKYGVPVDTIERWIIQDGVDFRYIWQRDEKIRMIPAEWIKDRVAGEGTLHGELLTPGNDAPPVNQPPAVMPSANPVPSDALLQLLQSQERNVAAPVRFLMLVVVAFLVIVGLAAGFLLFHQQQSQRLMDKHLVALEEKDGLLKDLQTARTDYVALQNDLSKVQAKATELADQLLAAQAAHQAALTKAMEGMKAESERLALATAEKEKLLKALVDQRKDIQKITEEVGNTLNNDRHAGRVSPLVEALIKQKDKEAELKKREATLRHEIDTVRLRDENLKLQTRIKQLESKLLAKDQQIKNLQQLISGSR